MMTMGELGKLKCFDEVNENEAINVMNHTMKDAADKTQKIDDGNYKFNFTINFYSHTHTNTSHLIHFINKTLLFFHLSCTVVVLN
jgi:hypothetical protein